MSCNCNNGKPVYHTGQDIKLKLAIKNGGTQISPTLYPWQLKVWVGISIKYVTAGYDGARFYGGASARDNFILVAIDSPEWLAGPLKAEMTLFIPDGEMPDGVRTEKYPVIFEAFKGIESCENIIMGTLSIESIARDAYQIAVRHGFTGTEEEWLLSLKGDKGDKGDSAFYQKDYDLTDPQLDRDITSDGGLNYDNIRGLYELHSGSMVIAVPNEGRCSLSIHIAKWEQEGEITIEDVTYTISENILTEIDACESITISATTPIWIDSISIVQKMVVVNKMSQLENDLNLVAVEVDSGETILMIKKPNQKL